MKKYRKILEKKRPALNSDQTNKEIQADIEKNIEILKELFKDCSDVVFRPFHAGKLKAYILFVDGFIDTATIEVSGIKQILNEVKDKEMSAEALMEQIVSLSAVEETSKLDEVVTNVLKGNTLLLVDKATRALIFDEKGGQRRGVGEPETESAVRGPREGFTEILRVNTALIRHRIRSNRLKIISRDVGEETNTGLAISYSSF